ncbi:MAG: tetratricopeptide repeat protein [Duncaniella sp.]|nr:tetratricopeptide repeat protein [Duncaniella sp.]
MSQIQNIEYLIAHARFEEALAALDALVDECPDDAVLLFMRGKLHWRMGHRSQATSDFSAASAIDPASPAARALEHARDVESFFNPDLYNP